MSGVTRFEDLVAWEKARELTRSVYEVSRMGGFAGDSGLARRIQRAAVSVMSNIAEGFDRGRLTEFHQFLSTAKASCAEVRSQLYVALDVGYLSQQDFDRLLACTEEVSRIVAGLRRSIDRHRTEQRTGR
jgi:four helix bundle protein